VGHPDADVGRAAAPDAAAPAPKEEPTDPTLARVARLEQARTLGQGDDGLLALAQHERADVRARVARALGHVGDPDTIEPLDVLLSDEDPKVRQEAAFGLALVAADLDPGDLDSKARVRASLLAAWKREPDAPSPDRLALLWSLRKLGGEQGEGVAAALRDPILSRDPATARVALLSWAMLVRFAPQTPGIKDPDILQAVAQRARDTDPEVRAAGTYALWRLADARYTPDLKAAAARTGHEPERGWALRGLAAAKTPDVEAARLLLMPPPEPTEEDPEPPDLRGDLWTQIDAIRHLGAVGDLPAQVVLEAVVQERLTPVAEHGTGLAGPDFHLLLALVEVLPQLQDKAKARELLERFYRASGPGGGVRRPSASLGEDLNAGWMHCRAAQGLDKLDKAPKRVLSCAEGLERAFPARLREGVVLETLAQTEPDPAKRASALAGRWPSASPTGKAAILGLGVELVDEATAPPKGLLPDKASKPKVVPPKVAQALAPLAKEAFEQKEDPTLAALGCSLRVKLREPELKPALEERLKSLNAKVDPAGALDLVLELLGGVGELKGDPALVQAWTANPSHPTRRKARAVLRALDPKLAPLPWEPDLSAPLDAPAPAPQGATLHTTRGDIQVALWPELAPATVQNFAALARKGFYQDVSFHRVIAGFVTQGGDPRGDGNGGPGWTNPAEWSPAPYDAGVLGMAHAGKDTEGSQFFFTHTPCPHLDGGYTAFGRVSEGMDVVRSLQIGDMILGVELSDAPPVPAKPAKP
jgi:cyclophilin family peptidyl-prolyl cis-trans isomerase/HEAT repeat protein